MKHFPADRIPAWTRSQRRCLAANRRRWDSLVDPHYASRFYGVAQFLRGEPSLLPLEVAEVGDVRGRRLLHLMCHFGLDTLDWARRGAQVTGVDFSPRAIRRARALADQAGLAATFMESDIYDLPRALSEEFDIVFSSYGILCWLPDLDRWARIIAHFLRPTGFFYLAEDHPITNVFEWNPRTKTLEPVRPYFGTSSPTREVATGSYAVKNSGRPLPTYEWTHTVSDVLNALRSAGLEIEFVHEFPLIAWRRYPCLRPRGDGYFQMPGRLPSMPLTFSVRAIRPRLTRRAGKRRSR